MEEIADDIILDLIQKDKNVEKGFRYLVHKYQEKVYWQIRRIVLDHEEANDVVQNTFLKVFKSIQRFERKSQLFTWIYRIATNEALTHRNKKKYTTSIDHEDLGIKERLKADPYFEGSEIQMQLQVAIDRLPQKQKMVFNMRYYDEMNYRQMSEILNTSEGALKASFHHAVKKIEGYFKEINV